MVTRGYWVLQRVTCGYKGSQGVTKGYKVLQRITVGYKRLPGVTKGYKGLQRITGGYKGSGWPVLTNGKSPESQNSMVDTSQGSKKRTCLVVMGQAD